MKKKLALTAAAVALVGTLAVGGTLAWFTDTETATNVITTGYVDVKITEPDPMATVEKDGYSTSYNATTGIQYSNVTPGTKLKKAPTVTYIGPTNAYVRYKVMVDVTAVSGKDLTEDEISTIKNGMKFYKDGTDVTESVNVGSYVYAGAVDGNMTVIYKTNDTVAGPIFDHVEIPNVGNMFSEVANITVNVVADAIQAANMDTNGDGTVTVAEVEAAFGANVEQYNDDALN